eukprot:GDKI01010592.1.p1 GENE.GDKI01010592.1~~GDKI01010592.1.p1  ORF type:complete len:864 (-),score=187.79 GDKI01010592.1:126-2717(-)
MGDRLAVSDAVTTVNMKLCGADLEVDGLTEPILMTLPLSKQGLSAFVQNSTMEGEETVINDNTTTPAARRLAAANSGRTSLVQVRNVKVTAASFSTTANKWESNGVKVTTKSLRRLATANSGRSSLTTVRQVGNSIVGPAKVISAQKGVKVTTTHLTDFTLVFEEVFETYEIENDGVSNPQSETANLSTGSGSQPQQLTANIEVYNPLDLLAVVHLVLLCVAATVTWWTSKKKIAVQTEGNASHSLSLVHIGALAAADAAAVRQLLPALKKTDFNGNTKRLLSTLEQKLVDYHVASLTVDDLHQSQRSEHQRAFSQHDAQLVSSFLQRTKYLRTNWRSVLLWSLIACHPLTAPACTAAVTAAVPFLSLASLSTGLLTLACFCLALLSGHVQWLATDASVIPIPAPIFGLSVASAETGALETVNFHLDQNVAFIIAIALVSGWIVRFVLGPVGYKLNRPVGWFRAVLSTAVCVSSVVLLVTCGFFKQTTHSTDETDAVVRALNAGGVCGVLLLVWALVGGPLAHALLASLLAKCVPSVPLVRLMFKLFPSLAVGLVCLGMERVRKVGKSDGIRSSQVHGKRTAEPGVSECVDAINTPLDAELVSKLLYITERDHPMIAISSSKPAPASDVSIPNGAPLVDSVRHMAASLKHEHSSDVLDPDHLAWCCHDSVPASDGKQQLAPVGDDSDDDSDIWHMPVADTDSFGDVQEGVQTDRGPSLFEQEWDQSRVSSEASGRLAPGATHATGTQAGNVQWSIASDSVADSDVQRQTVPGDRAVLAIEGLGAWVSQTEGVWDSTHVQQTIQSKVAPVVTGTAHDNAAVGDDAAVLWVDSGVLEFEGVDTRSRLRLARGLETFLEGDENGGE